ncbi:MAG TPA: DUF2779 domain-containing protein [Planctomycetota bacterium]|jgi:hypothetical protein|nr:DUF2779 domain-containing protein [Planctomycetota bacterium]OQC19184.1 MAG: hypothetical protein BWX69_02942 [Planctomycetes bacterium ADurb.Bin069]HNS00357.1 DUF2779 domain-containing protein [Planctomycetota bacterium]HNU26870.1 DUF2779 domain-containing protein [Planctomycetota bacterium]HOE30958.1 DUF2779 domain-containing protein [Planctomycetota bacterium]
MRLSKSRFTSGLQCHRRLWWEVHEPQAKELIPDELTQAIFDQGTRVGAVARSYVPGGRLVDLPHNAYGERIALTGELLREPTPAIYEATLTAGDVYAAIDILERAGDGFNLIEVKSSTRVKDEHIPDVAVQAYILLSNGLALKRAELMHLNPACVYPDLSHLFKRADVSARVGALQRELPRLIAEQLRVLAGGLPDASVGEHCAQPYACPFIDRCRGALPRYHVSTLYRVKKGGEKFLASGIETIDRLPAGLKLSEIQERQRRAVTTGRLVVEPGLAGALRDFEEPIAFLDFETVAPAIPVWNGCHPYASVPAQFSCHRLSRDGAVVHYEWLSEGPDDPRPEIARRVAEACRDARSIVAYNAPFERRQLEALADAAPELADELMAIAEKLLDLLPVVRTYVYHPDFAGSFSIKSVLPALVPGPGYEELQIAEGGVASARLERLLLRGGEMTAAERRRAAGELRRYCALDTDGLRRLLERLRGLKPGGD